MDSLSNMFKRNKKFFRGDILAGITVALALIPESVAFAFVAGVSPIISSSTAVIIGVVLSALMFAWEKGKIIYVNIEDNEDGSSTYKINRSLSN